MDSVVCLISVRVRIQNSCTIRKQYTLSDDQACGRRISRESKWERSLEKSKEELIFLSMSWGEDSDVGRGCIERVPTKSSIWSYKWVT